MKAKIIITALLLLSGGLSRADFECKDATGLLSVIADSKSGAGKVAITTEKDEIQMSAHVDESPTRVGSYYSYKLPIDGVSFSVSEQIAYEIINGCKQGGRATCDYDWSTSYKGYLTLNGKSYGLSCKAL